MPTLTARRLGGLTLACALATGSLAGCGGDDKASGKASSSPSSVKTTVEAGTPSPVPTATAPGDVKQKTKTTQIPVPKGGPREIANFPVPRGVNIRGPGAQDQSWQFDIATKDTEAVLAFYRKALAEKGYRVENDVRVTIGTEKVRYDIRFTGPATGYIVADPSIDDVFVQVQSLPKE